ncbi:hypothetical protein UB46_43115, partial [Burkholderiaceae bacterium 16]
MQQYSTWLVQRVIGLLNKVDSDLVAQLTVALDGMTATSFTVERLEGLLGSVRQLNLQAYREIERELTAQLREFAAYEGGYQLQLFQAVLPPQVVAAVGVHAVSIDQVVAATLSRPFQGRLLREWASSIEADRMVRIRDAIRIGFVEGQTTEQIIRRVRGTRAKGYSDQSTQVKHQQLGINRPYK